MLSWLSSVSAGYQNRVWMYTVAVMQGEKKNKEAAFCDCLTFDMLSLIIQQLPSV